jgi:hypothetical protein
VGGEEGVEVGVGGEAGLGTVVRAAEEDILSRRERVIKWLSRHCIYCEVTGAPQSNSKHWYKTCYRSQGLADGPRYEEAVNWKVGMEDQAFQTRLFPPSSLNRSGRRCDDYLHQSTLRLVYVRVYLVINKPHLP